MRILSIADIRSIESQAEGHPGLLMERAGRAAAHILLNRLHFPDITYYVFIGPGHNGGDGWLCAYWLAQAGCPVFVFDPHNNTTWQPSATPAITQWINTHHRPSPHPDTLSSQHNVLIDSVFGIGYQEPRQGTPYEAMLSFLKAHDEHTIVSLDVPSGLDADTGQARDPDTVTADITITFIAPKPGLLTGAGKQYTGEMICDDLGLTTAIQNHPSQPILLTNTPDAWRPLPCVRHPISHKGTHGHLLIIGGSEGMLGAPLLAARAAIHTGVGKCFVHYTDPDHAPSFDPLYPEILMSHNKRQLFSEHFLEQMDTIAIGPGLGTLNYVATPLIKAVLQQKTPCILDADALTVMSQDQGLVQLCQQRIGTTILTPHPKEAARLLHCSVERVESDRLKAASQLAERYQAHVLIKGPGSILLSADRQQGVINTTGQPNLATGGTGDLLTGIIAALLTEYRTYSHFAAFCYGVYLHGHTSDVLDADGYHHGLPSHLFLSKLQQTVYDYPTCASMQPTENMKKSIFST